jgi:SAM-dependent methyltransferase
MRSLPRSLRVELLDAGRVSKAELETNLHDLKFINHWAGGNQTILSPLRRQLTRWPNNRPLRILDVGTGGGDLVHAVRKLCRKAGIRSQVVGLDRSVQVLDIARRLSPERNHHWVQGEALSLPFARASFDYVVSSLVLHHIPPSKGSTFLRELSRVARMGVLVTDLRRGRWEYACTFLFSRLFLHGRMTLHDAPLSVLRSLTLSEARNLVVEAGWQGGRVKKIFPLRILLASCRPH